MGNNKYGYRNFCAFILSHGRPDNIRTYETLRKYGYTGRIVFVLDDEDSTIMEYRARYGAENVEVFCKEEYMDRADSLDNMHYKKCILYARNATNDIARRLGITHYVELDDDYTAFYWRFNSRRQYHTSSVVKDLDKIFNIMLDFLDTTNCETVAMAQGGDFIGGGDGIFGKKIFLRRKAMNSWMFKTNNPLEFYGTLNDDVNSYVRNGNIGKKIFTQNITCLIQMQSQLSEGGISDIYREMGTYTKSFYTVMIQPSSVKVRRMATSHPRIHHCIKWIDTVPMIMNEKWKKK